MERAIRAEANGLVQKMFVTTADGNYILARNAFFMALDYDFFWLGAHALEKYLKAVLLMNGRSALSQGHQIVQLFDEVKNMDARLAIDALVDPQIEDLGWRQESVREFLVRLSELGSPDNRYGVYGFSQRMEDLFKLDQAVWLIRRYCRTFTYTIPHGGKTITVDYVDQVLKGSTSWSHMGFLPLERLLERSHEDPDRAAFLRHNVPFAPNADHQLHRLSWRSADPPFADLVSRIRSTTASAETREHAARVIAWALSNIKLSSPDRKTLQAILDQHAKA
jgi:hypothetical protein